jgi:hypothetical protein
MHSEYEEVFVLSSCLTKIFDSTRRQQEEIFILSSCSAKDFDPTGSKKQTQVN